MDFNCGGIDGSELSLESDATQGLEDISLSDEKDSDTSEEDTQCGENIEVCGCTFDSESAVNGLDDVMGVNLKDMKAEDIMRFHFPNLEPHYSNEPHYLFVRPSA